ncbi:MAG: TIGR01777 family oxidoreductase [Cytophagaceae bacterium]|nr:TIGR01777 family oxidoreductase [Cytophagaceae bacterium]
MKQKVLITGGSGLIGTRLTEMLQEKNYEVLWLSRTAGDGKVKKYVWDIPKKAIDAEALKNADYIVNLAGASVFDKKWTKEFKKEILNSRTESVNILYEHFKKHPHHVKAFISATAIGYYGADTGDKLITESEAPGKDFLAEVVDKWEKEVDKIDSLNIRTIKVRVGIVLSNKGGALEKMMGPIKMNAGSPLGSGKQIVSWIHIDDICNVFIKAIEDQNMKGVYNAVAPQPVTNEELTKKSAEAIGKSIHLPNVPGFALKMMLGSEKAALVLGGNNVSSEKLQKSGFKFQFPDLKSALDNLLK